MSPSPIDQHPAEASQAADLAEMSIAAGAESIRSLRRWLTIVVLVLAFFQAFAHRYGVLLWQDPGDQLSYLDMSSAVVRGDWHNFVNGYWSPLQPLLFGLGMRVFSIPRQHELLALALLNFLIAAASWWTFCYLWTAVVRRATASHDSHRWRRAWWLLGFTLFAWCAFELNQLVGASRDLLLAAWIFLASGVLLRIRDQGPTYARYSVLGLAIGLGYLTKAFLFPMGIVFLALSLLAGWPLARALPRAALAAVIFLMICAAWIVPLSRQKGRLTYGDVGPVAYAWIVNHGGEWDLQNWPGLRHPPRVLVSRPLTFEYASPVAGTYPMWYDASYWCEGVKFEFHPARQARALITAVIREITFPRQWEFGGVALFLLFLRRRRSLLPDLLSQWDLILPCVIALAAYALVYVEERYAAPFLALFWAGVLAAILRPSAVRLSRIFFAFSLAAALIVGGTVARHIVHDFQQFSQSNRPWRAAQAMQQYGLRPGDAIAYVGEPDFAFWAHSMDVRIVAHVENYPQFWAADPATQARVLAAFATTPASFAVADNMPAAVPPPGWQPVGDTGYFIHPLAK